MEQTIWLCLSDITYTSELTPTPIGISLGYEQLVWGLIRPYNLRYFVP